MLKVQVPTGKRGKGGGIVAVETAEEAQRAAAELLGSQFGDFTVERLLVEARVEISREIYAAVTIDPAAGAPLLVVSTEGGVDIEQVHASSPELVHMLAIDILEGLSPDVAAHAATRSGLSSDVFSTLYDVFRRLDAQLLEINPFAITTSGEQIALDAKLVVDDNAVFRQGSLPPERPIGSPLELKARSQDFLFVELEGDVGVLANGAGLTMATMDAVTAHGGRPANFLEVGGMAYKRATPALALVLDNPNVKSLLVNLCGAYARTDVIAEGLIAGWKELRPDVPVSFCIHGTGEERAQQLVRDELGVEPHDTMAGAVREAIEMATRR